MSQKMSISPDNVWKLPHSHYLAYMRWNRIFDLQQSEEGREVLKWFDKVQNPRTKADYGSIRKFGGYQAKEGGEK
ncbi:hypothetical protein [Oceanobacillus massiliensis]|uniref:hypothetical protein n=1 Tax=Oceanobacillus massiliensis TaxID=1465765 RepID=UPI003018E688